MVEVRKLRIITQLIIGTAIMLWLLQIADLKNVLSIILKVNPLNLGAAACLFILASACVALALYVPLKSYVQKISMRKVVLASFAGQLLSDVTPARSGYFLTPIFLNNLADVPFEHGMVGVLTTGGINSIVKVTVCLLGMVYFASFLSSSIEITRALMVSALVLLAGGIFLLALTWEKRILNLVVKFEKFHLSGEEYIT